MRTENLDIYREKQNHWLKMSDYTLLFIVSL